MATSFDCLAQTRGLIDAFNRHDIDGVLAHASPDLVVRQGDGSTIDGAANVASRLGEFLTAVPDAHLEVRKMVPFDGGAVLVEWTLTGTHLGPLALAGSDAPVAATGRAVSFAGADVLTFSAAGLITSDETRIATATFLAQIGVGAPQPMAPDALRAFAESYTKAWNDHDMPAVAGHFALDADRVINGGAPASGRDGIEADSQAFLTDVRDLNLTMDNLYVMEDLAVYCWTLRGTHGETGNRLNIAGFEIFQMGTDGLIASSRGYFDSAAYSRHVEYGAD